MIPVPKQRKPSSDHGAIQTSPHRSFARRPGWASSLENGLRLPCGPADRLVTVGREPSRPTSPDFIFRIVLRLDSQEDSQLDGAADKSGRSWNLKVRDRTSATFHGP